MSLDTQAPSVVTMIRKRDGQTVQPFDADKLHHAISRAWQEAKGSVDEKALGKVINQVVGWIGALGVDTVNVEQVQDMVETALLRQGRYDVGKAYILYRHKRAEARQARTPKSPDPKAISDYIHAGKYARYVRLWKRREIYTETVSRVEDMHIGQYPQLADEIRWAFNFVREKRVLPSMRSMQFGGPAIEALHNRIYNCSFSLVDRPEVFSEALFLLLAGCGVGYSVQFDHVEKLPSIGYVDTKKVRHHVVEDTIEGWADALKALIQSYIDGVNLEFAYHLIRPAGAPLRTSGGRAPGHLKLKDSLERIRGVLSSAQGRKLRPIECHRIMCHAADAVLSGGIRRSAMIALFSRDDSEMMYCKTGNWWQTDPWFANANNSVVLLRGETKKKEFKRIFGMTRQWGEPGFYFSDDPNYGTNPSMPAGTLVCTREGIFPIEQLEGRHFEVKSLDGTFAKAKCWLSSECADVLEIGFGQNQVTHSTKEHRWPVKVGDTIIKKYASELQPGDLIPLNRNESAGIEGDMTLTRDEGFMVGYIFGDGSLTRREAGTYTLSVSISEEKLPLAEKLLKLINEMKNKPSTITRRDRDEGGVEYTIQTTEQGFIQTLMSRYGLSTDKSAGIPSKVWTSNDGFIVGFIDGLLSTDGCVSVSDKRLTFTTAYQSVALDFAKLISFYGVPSSTSVKEVPSRFPNGKDYGRLYSRCDVRIGLSAITNFANVFDLSHESKQANLLSLVQEAGKSRQADSNSVKASFAKVQWVKPVEPQRVWDISVQHEQHVFPSQYAYTGNCCEIGLYPVLTITEELRDRLAAKGRQTTVGQTLTGWAFCNLCEINAAKLTSLEDFKTVAKAATIIGTLQAGYTKMPYLGWVSETIAEREALLGIGMTGILDAPHIALNPEYQREVAGLIKTWNAEYAAKIGINPAARTTCVKPSGTTSLELGCVGSGIHPHHARRYIRRVTADELEYVFQAFRAVNPHMCVRKPDGKYVIEFPVEAPAGATVRSDLNAVQFLDMVKSTQQHWVLTGTADSTHAPGLNHNVSNTVTVRPDEWDKVADYLWENREFFTGVSLLASTGDKDFAFAPNEEVTTPADEARWNQLIEHYKPVDYTAMTEEDDSTNLSGEAACAGGACLI